jgi:sugar phosphate isomerase/epimerase
MKKDTAGTLAKLKSIGYTHVEHAGYEDRKFYGYRPDEFKKLLDDTGLRMDSGHSFLGASQYDRTRKDFKDEWKYTMEDAARVGMKYVISPGLDEDMCGNIDDFKWYMDVFNRSGELARQSDLSFAYHNEGYEFDHKLENIVLYELVLKFTDPSVVAQQIDIGNMYATGGRAMDFLRKYKGRFELMHVKDVRKSTSGEGFQPAPLGKGLVGVKEALDFGRSTGIKYFIIEEKAYDGKTVLTCAQENLSTMHQWGF